jgi:hypothetical protein
MLLKDSSPFGLEYREALRLELPDKVLGFIEALLLYCFAESVSVDG